MSDGGASSPCGGAGAPDDSGDHRGAVSWVGPPPRPSPDRQASVCLRAASSHPCRISTAAAWSTTARRRPPRTPRSASLRVATTVDILSSASRTGMGAMAPANSRAYTRTCSAAGPSVPARFTGRPTTTSTLSWSSTSRTTSAISCGTPSPGGSRSRRRVVNGVAKMPAGSLLATPTLTFPTSIPSRTPGRQAPFVRGRRGRLTAVRRASRPPRAGTAPRLPAPHHPGPARRSRRPDPTMRPSPTPARPARGPCRPG